MGTGNDKWERGMTNGNGKWEPVWRMRTRNGNGKWEQGIGTGNGNRIANMKQNEKAMPKIPGLFS